MFGAAVLLWIGLLLALPAYLESGAFSRTLATVGLPDLAWEIRRAGLFGADIAAVRIGPPEAGGPAVDAVRLDYSPARRHLDRVVVTGLEMTCGVEEGRFFIRGLDLDALTRRFGSEPSPAGSQARPGDAFAIPGFLPEVIEVRHSRIYFTWEKRPVRLPVDLRLVFPREGDRLFQLRLHTRLLEQEITCTGEADRSSGASRWQVSAAGIPAARLLQAAGMGLVPAAAGTLDIRLETGIRMGEDGIAGDGKVLFALTPREAAANDSRKRGNGLHFSTEFTFGLPASGEWHFSLAAPDPQADGGAASLRLGEMGLEMPLPRFSITGAGTGGTGAVRCRVEAGPLRAVAPEAELRVKALTMDADIRFSGPEPVQGTLSFGGKEATLAADLAGDRAVLRLPSLSLAGDAVLAPSQGLRFNGKADLAEAGLTLPGSRASVEGIRLSLPLTWPWGISDNAGSLEWRAFRRGRQEMGALTGRLRPRPEGLGFEGEFTARLLPGLTVKLKGEAPFLVPGKASALSWSTQYRPARPLDLGRLTPGAKGLTLEGTLRVDGRMAFGGGSAASGEMSASLGGGRITAREKDLRVEDLRLDLRLPALPAIWSVPAQSLSLGRATLGKIRVEEADLRFQIEPEGSLLIEQGRFTWCGGRVNTQAVRIAPGMTDLDLILHCDRLNLAQLLDQLGAARAEGKGAVNGRLPIRLRNGTVRFEDGFFYSTPGDGGVIHVTGARVLTAGIPENTPQFAQVDLAVEALKSYEYTWAKLGIDTEGENLRLNLQFDGRPTGPLPFVYQKEFGGFVRVSADHPGSVFQGIRLDVNLGLPLDRILRYRGLLEMIP